jgi:hypothetical protein
MLFRTKHLIVDVIRVQAGDTLTEILETPATEEQVQFDNVRSFENEIKKKVKLGPFAAFHSNLYKQELYRVVFLS